MILQLTELNNMELQEQLELFEKPDSDEVFTRIHNDVKEQLRKCLDNDDCLEWEAGQNMGVINFFR